MALETKGQVALPFVLLVAGIVTEIVLAGAFIVSFLNSGSRSGAFLIEATSLSRSAVQDASVKISANKDFDGGGSYCFISGADKVKVNVSRDDSSPDFIKYVIKALGKKGSVYSEMSAALSVEKISGQIQFEDLKEEPVSLIYDC